MAIPQTRASRVVIEWLAAKWPGIENQATSFALKREPDGSQILVLEIIYDDREE